MTITKSGTAKTEAGKEHPLVGRYSAQLISDTGQLTQFGAFIETLPPGSSSSLMHWHSNEDEMIYVLTGDITLYEGDHASQLAPGDAACFKAGDPVGHCLKNLSDQDASYMVIGTRSDQDTVTYPGRDRRLIRNGKAREWTDEAGNPATSAYDDPPEATR
ncbi:cupin domain-containing protein [Roseobacter sp. YSTF-M11]|uniref:Cupin domain-containing protein n=1 Tax=Roseobacter insulae TaxID=2859783 RepID=A0A9X1K0M5_9RHOB|nr:cupin domain-containing protein [Roseobacter insulae]MBW4710430.1 cupin domain-containing protein [Roseobacter insulae]